MNGIYRRLAQFGAAVAITSFAAASAAAQASTSNSVPYDPIMAKHADLRAQFDKSAHCGTVSAGMMSIDHCRFVDFINMLPKRSDLRVRVGKVGLEQAYAEWSGQK